MHPQVVDSKGMLRWGTVGVCLPNDDVVARRDEHFVLRIGPSAIKSHHLANFESLDHGNALVVVAAVVAVSVVVCVLTFWLQQKKAWFVKRLVVWFVVTSTRMMMIVLALLTMMS